MPLPLPFANPAKGKTLYSITEDDSEGSDDDVDGVLAILRSRSKYNKTSGPSVPSYENKSSKLGSKNDIDRATPPPATSGGTPASSDRKTDLVSGTRAPKPVSDTELRVANESIKEIIECQQKQQSDAQTVEETNNCILGHISSNREELLQIRQDVTQLQSSFTSTETQSEELSQSVKVLITSVAKSQKDLELMSNSIRMMAEGVNASNVEHKQSLMRLELSIESERNNLQAQISNERMSSADQKRIFEREIDMLRREKESLEIEKRDMFIEKERLVHERTQLERSEALLEQRKTAAREELENADKTTAMIREAEARVSDEMEKLIHLSEFVMHKDAEAQEKLAQVEETSKKLTKIDSSIKHDFENAERQRQEISESRMNLARERVSLLKERFREKDLALVEGPHYEGMSLTSNFDFMQPSMRNALASIKDDLNKLRHE